MGSTAAALRAESAPANRTMTINEDSKLLQSDEVAYGHFGAYAKMVATAAMRTI
jgi:hypothetical protein